MEAEIVNIESKPKRRGGRPKKSPAALRNKRLNVRFTESEYAALCEKAATVNLTPTDYAHSQIIGADIPKSVPQANLEIYAELAHLSANLNQLTKIANAGGNYKIEIEGLKAIYSKVIALRKSLLGVEK